ncbi:lysophospholipid acyltransferase family protein [Chloroflexota bacterium]
MVSFIKIGLWIICRIKAEGLDKIPFEGPIILYSNHTGAIEIPIMYVVVQPRIVTGMAKIESWDKPLLRWLFNLFEFIPVRRGEPDLAAFRQTLDWLRNGHILGISPEGTRNRDGKLLKAHPGIVALAQRSGASLIPVAHWGGEKLKSNIRRLKRTDFNIKVGEVFTINIGNQKLTKDIRQNIVDEMMYELADLLPEQYHGEYSTSEKRKNKYLSKRSVSI